MTFVQITCVCNENVLFYWYIMIFCSTVHITRGKNNIFKMHLCISWITQIDHKLSTLKWCQGEIQEYNLHSETIFSSPRYEDSAWLYMLSKIVFNKFIL